MSDKRVYLLTKEQADWLLRSAHRYEQVAGDTEAALTQDVRCATCRWWQDGWQCLPDEDVLLTAEATGGDYTTALATTADHACSMWQAAPEPGEGG